MQEGLKSGLVYLSWVVLLRPPMCLYITSCTNKLFVVLCREFCTYEMCQFQEQPEKLYVTLLNLFSKGLTNNNLKKKANYFIFFAVLSITYRW